MTEVTVLKNLLANAVQYPELFDDAPQPLDGDPAPNQPPRKPQFLASQSLDSSVWYVHCSSHRLLPLLAPARPVPSRRPSLRANSKSQSPKKHGKLFEIKDASRIGLHCYTQHETIQGHRRSHPLAEVTVETFDFALNQSLFRARCTAGCLFAHP
jgi:hypothetical protein